MTITNDKIADVLFEGVLKNKGELTVQLAGRPFQVKHKVEFIGHKIEVKNSKGELVPPTSKPVSQVANPPGAHCAKHQQNLATYACARCGTFACASCESADLIHCEICFPLLTAQANRNAQDMLYMVPAIAFMAMGGAIGGLLGGAAGAGSVAIAKRIDSKVAKVLACIGLYGVAGIIWLVIVSIIRS